MHCNETHYRNSMLLLCCHVDTYCHLLRMAGGCSGWRKTSVLSGSDLFRLGFIMSRNARNDRGKRTWAQVVSRGVEGKSRTRRRSQAVPNCRSWHGPGSVNQFLAWILFALLFYLLLHVYIWPGLGVFAVLSGGWSHLVRSLRIILAV